jgi:hypothetical protein
MSQQQVTALVCGSDRRHGPVRPARPGRGLSRKGLAAATLTVVLLLAGCGGSDSPSDLVGELPAGFPEDFPLPTGANVASTGDALTLHVDATAEDVTAFYADALPESGWEIVQDWDGVDANGEPAVGYAFERGDELGVLSISDSDDVAILRVNLQQPRNDPSRGMNAPGPRTPPDDTQ